MDINYHAYQAPQFRILSGRQIEKVYRATLEYITRIGVNVLNAEARDLFARAGALEIAHQNSVAPNDISRICVHTFVAAVKLSRAHPRNTEQAQYNLAYPVAAALIDGELGPRQVLPPRIHDGAVLALADRVEAEVAPEYE
jgi:trimethylamine:corrinoid methyltransferase-like protein